jgi:predicted extracellular nuclease
MKKIYFLIAAAISTASANAQLFINEVLASNNSQSLVVDTNEYGKREDWFEIYNAGNSSVDLAGYKVSDSKNKFKTIPSGFAFTTVPAKGFIRIWADDSTTVSGNTQLHVKFKISSSGDAIILKNAADETLDSVAFGAQTANVSYGRCPDGSSDFDFFSAPTPAASNCASTGVSEIFYSNFSVYPNPAKNRFTVVVEGNATVKIFSVQGAIMITENISQTQEFSTVNFSKGLYFVEVSKGKLISTKKLIVE